MGAMLGIMMSRERKRLPSLVAVFVRLIQPRQYVRAVAQFATSNTLSTTIWVISAKYRINLLRDPPPAPASN
jgi:hypothetical protein